MGEIGIGEVTQEESDATGGSKTGHVKGIKAARRGSNG